ncbi:hypothetical protein GCM10007276_16380 [Agaricicola taiwanensis]|uniref:Uncharacterized protein n=1 Tax=Agaricicola taiwanensis TaxID=591372 RepID=A0A8J2VS92_9RHOB|nr:hypothetical protein [Agaricicola taiwanensis]GGE39771.1 hypothetical protein GCM10007276_16380 [Agaricicola taiwanensis]
MNKIFSTVASQPALLRRLLAASAATAVVVGSVPAILSYPGGTWQAVLFCLISGGLLPLATLNLHSPFRVLTALFLALGFWAKFVAHFAVGAAFIEPIGNFAGTPAAWDQALTIASAGLAGVVAALVCMPRLEPRPQPAGGGSADLLVRFGVAILVISSVLALAVFAFNYGYAILRIGFVPKLSLHPFLYVPVAFAVSWGILLWLLGLTWWLIERGRLPPSALVYIAAAEGALATLSMGSRVQMILHVLAGLFALGCGMRWRGWRISITGLLKLAVIVAPLFIGTLLLVSVDRAISFAEAIATVPAETAGQTTAPGNAAPSRDAAPIDAEKKREMAVASSLRTIPHEISRLFVMRWVGLDGVLATVADDELGMPLLRRAALEQPAVGVDAIYQKMSGSPYARLDKFVFMTIPGPVAVAAFSGSAVLCFLFMAAAVMAGTLIEGLAGRLTANPAIAAVAGVAMAYLLVQLNFPRTLFFFVIELLLAVFAVSLFARVMRTPAGRISPTVPLAR